MQIINIIGLWRTLKYDASELPKFNSSLPILIIQKLINNTWNNFLVIAESAILNSLNIPKQYGLYFYKN